MSQFKPGDLVTFASMRGAEYHGRGTIGLVTQVEIGCKEVFDKYQVYWVGPCPDTDMPWYRALYWSSNLKRIE